MHPLVKILCFISLLLLISMANYMVLSFMALISIAMALALKMHTFWHALRRMRWLFLSMLIIYAFGTPGELISFFPVNFAPTVEGLQLGLVQIEKLLLALAALSILLTSSPKQQMMLGLYMLLTPLKFTGLNIERFAARLMLTLDYVEELASRDKGQFSFNQLDEIDGHIENLPQANVVLFQKQPLGLMDKLVLLMLPVLFIFMICRGLT